MIQIDPTNLPMNLEGKRTVAEADAAAMREIVIRLQWSAGTGEDDYDEWCEECLYDKPNHTDDCSIKKALDGTAGQALLDKLERLEKTINIQREALAQENKTISAARKAILQCSATAERLSRYEEVLRYYADKYNWDSFLMDRGGRARGALGEGG